MALWASERERSSPRLGLGIKPVIHPVRGRSTHDYSQSDEVTRYSRKKKREKKEQKMILRLFAGLLLLGVGNSLEDHHAKVRDGGVLAPQYFNLAAKR